MSNNAKNNSTDDLINQLSDDLKAVTPRSPYKRMAIWLVLSIAYLVGVVAYLGVRMDIADRLTDSIFLFETLLATAILLSASIASSWLNFPDSLQRPWIKIVPLTLFGVFSLWVVVRGIEEGMVFISTLHMAHCSEEGAFMEVAPIIALVIITMRGNTTQPYWSMAMNVLAVSALGWIGLRLTCPMDQMGHSFINHLLPFAIVGAGLGFFARKLFRW